MLLKELFYIYNGIASSYLDLRRTSSTEYNLPYIRPSSTWKNLITGYLNKDKINSKFIYPEKSLIVSTNGEGSHTYSYVVPFMFVPNSDVSVLVPKNKMGIKEKIFYAMCITHNRRNFSYGRKPKGERLGKIKLPLFRSEWANEIHIPDVNWFANTEKDIKVSGKNLIPLYELFNVTYGNQFDLNKMITEINNDRNTINFVSRTSKNLGVICAVRNYNNIIPNPPGLITVALGGSVLSSFVQEKQFYTAQNIAVLKPKRKMSFPEKVFYCMCIKANQFKYMAFGREANRTLRFLLVPSYMPAWINNREVKKYFDLINKIKI